MVALEGAVKEPALCESCVGVGSPWCDGPTLDDNGAGEVVLWIVDGGIGAPAC